MEPKERLEGRSASHFHSTPEPELPTGTHCTTLGWNCRHPFPRQVSWGTALVRRNVVLESLRNVSAVMEVRGILSRGDIVVVA